MIRDLLEIFVMLFSVGMLQVCCVQLVCWALYTDINEWPDD